MAETSRNLFEDFGEGPRSVNVFEDAAALPFQFGFNLRKSRQSGSLAAHLAFQRPASDASDNYDHEQKADEDSEVANVEQGRPGDDLNIIEGTQQDIERRLIVEWIGIHGYANARDPDCGSQWNLQHRRDRPGNGRVAVNCRK